MDCDINFIQSRIEVLQKRLEGEIELKRLEEKLKDEKEKLAKLRVYILENGTDKQKFDLIVNYHLEIFKQKAGKSCDENINELQKQLITMGFRDCSD